jgi:hypothetical protein
MKATKSHMGLGCLSRLYTFLYLYCLCGLHMALCCHLMPISFLVRHFHHMGFSKNPYKFIKKRSTREIVSFFDKKRYNSYYNSFLIDSRGFLEKPNSIMKQRRIRESLDILIHIYMCNLTTYLYFFAV